MQSTLCDLALLLTVYWTAGRHLTKLGKSVSPRNLRLELRHAFKNKTGPPEFRELGTDRQMPGHCQIQACICGSREPSMGGWGVGGKIYAEGKRC